jgi:hypothetical protein
VNLQRLIEATKGDRSYETLSKATLDADPDRPGERAVKTARFGQLGTLALEQPPNVGTIRGLAVALGVTERAVWDAVAESLGINVGRSSLAEMLPPGADGLSPASTSLVRQLVARLVHLERSATT